MSRIGDTGPYSVENLAIVTNTENIVERCERDFGGDYTETSNKAIKEAIEKSSPIVNAPDIFTYPLEVSLKISFRLN